MKFNLFVILSFISFIGLGQETRYFKSIDFKKTSTQITKYKRIYNYKDKLVNIEDYKDSMILLQAQIKGLSKDQIDDFIYYCSGVGRNIEINYREFFKNAEAEFTLYLIDSIRSRKYWWMFVKDKDFKNAQAWDEKGEEYFIKGNGVIKEISKNGNTQGYFIYKDSVLVDGYNVRIKENDTIYAVFDKMAQPKEGFDNFYANFKKEMNALSFTKNYETRIQFIINKEGKLEEIKSLRKEPDDIDEYIIHYLQKIPNWNPATKDGKRVKTIFKFPVNFQNTI